MNDHKLTTFWIADWFVDAHSNRIQRVDLVRRLEKRTMDVLVKLAEQGGKTVSKDEIIAFAWPTHVVSDQSVATAISDLRRALDDDPRKPVFIETVPKRGYRLISPVSQSRPRTAETDLNPSPNQNRGRQPIIRGAHTWPVAVAIAIGVFSFSLANFQSNVSSSEVDTRPIVVGDICVGDVDTVVQDLAYGFNELLTVELANSPDRTVIRVADENDFASDHEATQINRQNPLSSPILIDSAIIESDNGSIVVLEALDGRTYQLLWAEKYPISSQSIEAVARDVSEQILAIDATLLTSSLLK